MKAPGMLIIDANVIWQLENPSVRDKVERSLRAADLEFRPTAINVLEAVRTPDPSIRHRLLATLEALAHNRPVRPLPSEALALTGRMIVAGESIFRWPESRLEWMLYEPERITDVHIVGAANMLDQEQANFDSMHRAARKHVRQFLKAKGVKDPWGGVPEFLDAQWTTVSQLDSLVEKAWATLKLPGTPDIARVLENEAWRLYFEGFGATVYERAIHSQSLSPVHAADIRQLVYLAGARRRVLVTDDGGLVRVATHVLTRRYPGARVLRFREFLDLAS
jgi:hypothetical protein